MTTLTFEDFKAYHGDNDLAELKERYYIAHQQYGELRCEYQSSVSFSGDAWAGADHELAEASEYLVRLRAAVESHYQYH